MFVGLNFLGKRWLFWGEMTAERLRYCLIRPVLRVSFKEAGACFLYLLLFLPGWEKKQIFETTSPSLILKKGLVKQYISLSAVISPQTTTSSQESWDQHTFHPNAATGSPTKSCNYTKQRKPSQHLDKQMTCNELVLALHWIEHSCNKY